MLANWHCPQATSLGYHCPFRTYLWSTYNCPNVIMTSSNGNIFRVTGPLCGDSTVAGVFLSQRPVTRSFDVLSDLRWINNPDAGHFRRHCAHSDVTLMWNGVSSRNTFSVNTLISSFDLKTILPIYVFLPTAIVRKHQFLDKLWLSTHQYAVDF